MTSVAQISASPALVDFGTVAVGVTARRDVTISNTGAARLAIASMGLTGNTAALSCTGCAATHLGAGEQVTVSIQFSPVDASSAVGRLVVVSDAANAPELLVSIAGNSVGSCTPETDAALCQRLGRACGVLTAVDTCGATRTISSCGTCASGQACGASNVCGCDPETDAELCAKQAAVCGTLSMVDRCGATRLIASCGACSPPQTCTAGACGCTPESDAALCAAQARGCDALETTDQCGHARHIASCGSCGSNQTCGGGGAPGVCGCTGESDAALCAAQARSCGPLDVTDRCGRARHVASCGPCGSNQTCGGGGTPGVCGCTPESDGAFCVRLGKSCGAFTGPDNCGAPRSVASCGTCTAPAHAAPVCSATNACDFACVTGYQRAGVVCVPACTPEAQANSPFAGGSGTVSDPYLLCTVAQLDHVRDVATKAANFQLLANLDLSGSSFAPIGDAVGHAFNGVFVGGGHSLSNWHYSAPSTDSVGLFSQMSGTVSGLRLVACDVTGRDRVGALTGTQTSGATVTDITVSGRVAGRDYVGGVAGTASWTMKGVTSSADVSGHGWVGGLIGAHSGVLSASSATGSVTGTGDAVGGLVGSLYGDADLAVTTSYATGAVTGVNSVGGAVGLAYTSNSGLGSLYATGAVSGATGVGGLVGTSNVPVVNAYSLGSVTGTASVGGLVGANNSLIGHAYSQGLVTGTTQVGGLVGSNGASPLAVAADAYWDTTLSGQSSSALGVGKTSAQLQSAAPFAKWDTLSIWKVGSGTPTFVSTPAPCVQGAGAFSGGTGTVADPYLIDQPGQLYHVGCNLGRAFKLTADLDFAGQPMVPPIGTGLQAFTGTFDGNGKTISNWVAYGGQVALFQSVYGTVHDLTLANVEVGGSVGVAALVSSNMGTLTKVRSSGVVRGVYVVAGLVANHGGHLSRSSSSVATTAGTGNGGASAYVGGLVGYSGASISDCYATGSVTSLDLAAGGLIGDNVGASAVVTNSYSTGLVTKGSGFASGNTASAVSCYWDTETSGRSTSTYGVGKTTAQMKDPATYTGWDFTTIWQMTAGSYPTLR